MPKYFTKSAFKQALDCPASLYYYYDRDNYANQTNEDDFLQSLAEGGQQAGDLAKVYYDVQPDADIKSLNYEESLKQTKDLFTRGSVNIAEAAFLWKDCFVRADIIEKKGKLINLIEVKAKSFDPTEESFFGKKKNANTISRDFFEYIYDVAFQKYVIQNALGPDYTVKAYLMMADKTVVSDAPKGVNQYFRVVNRNGRAEIERAEGADELRRYEHVLSAFDVDDICDRIIAGRTDEQTARMGCLFTDFVEKMSKTYVNHERCWSKVKADCFKCPFYSNEKTPGKLDGKRECWMKMANFKDADFEKPSVADLWCGGLGPRSLKKEFVEKGKVFLSDLKEADIPESNVTGPGLKPSERRLLQIALACGNDRMLQPFKGNMHDGVYLDVPGLKAEMATWKYPLHMIDFETTAVALPFYEGMRPYEQVAFQFSHHVIEQDGTVRHAGQYINTEKHKFPNFEFVRKLKGQLENDNGTVFRYAMHENTILRVIRRQLEGSDEKDRDALMAFIDSITVDKKTNYAGPRKMVDLLEVVKSYYYHPDMKGSNSIKVVLPAILNSSKAIRDKYSKPIYGSLIHSENFTPAEAKPWISVGGDGKVENPYKHLDAIASFLEVSSEELEEFDTTRDISSEGAAIANGGAALAAYTKLQFSDEAMSKALEKALLRYCELDTMSMVFIWEYFHEMTS